MTKNFTVSGWSVCIAVITALVGMIIYIVTSTTGFLAGLAVNPLPIVCTTIAIIFAIILLNASNKLNPILVDITVVAVALLLIASFAIFVLARVSLVADVHFIPVNYPDAEESALNLSLVGIVFYVVSIVAMIIISFSEKLRNA